LWPIRDTLEGWAFLALVGVGDTTLGEWQEWTGKAYHIRRRLTDAEAALVGPVVDVRGTPEAERRLARVRHRLPKGYTE
jgi:hypothetical protein